MNTETIQKVVTDKPSSFEFGRAGNRFKIYFNTPEDLKKEIQSLETIGLISSEDNPLNKTQLNKNTMEVNTNGINN